MGPPLGRRLHAHLARRLLGRRHPPPHHRRRQKGRHPRRRVHRHPGPERSTSPIPLQRLRQAHLRLRNLEDSMGRHQSLPAPHRRARPALQRHPTKYPRRFHLVTLGLPRLLRRPSPPRNEEVVRHQRQQLCSCSRVRRESTRKSSNRRRRDRRPLIPSLQQPGQALQHRRPPRRLLLSFRSKRTHRAPVPSRKLIFDL